MDKETSMPTVESPEKLLVKLRQKGDFARIDFRAIEVALHKNRYLDKQEVADVLQTLIDCECVDYFSHRNPDPVEKAEYFKSLYAGIAANLKIKNKPVTPAVENPDVLLAKLREKGDFARIDFHEIEVALRKNADLNKQKIADVLQALFDCECVDYFSHRNPDPAEQANYFKSLYASIAA